MSVQKMFGVYCSFSFLIVWWRFHIDCVRLEYSITCFMQHGWVCFVFVFVFICFFLSSFQINICVVASLYGSGLESDAVSNIFRGVVKMSAFISSDSIVASRLNWLWNEQSEASGLLLLLVD